MLYSPQKIRSHLSKPELPHATKMNGNNRCNKIYFPPHFVDGVAKGKTLCHNMNATTWMKRPREVKYMLPCSNNFSSSWRRVMEPAKRNKSRRSWWKWRSTGTAIRYFVRVHAVAEVVMAYSNQPRPVVQISNWAPRRCGNKLFVRLWASLNQNFTTKNLEFAEGFQQFKPLNSLHIQAMYAIKIRDKWVPVTTAWRILRLRMEERHPIWMVAANILSEQSRTAEKG